MLHLNSKYVQHVKIYLACNFKVNLITHLEVIALFSSSHVAIVFYVKTMSAHGSHLGWNSWSPVTILKVYYPKIIHAKFALNWLTGLRMGSILSKLLPVTTSSIQDGCHEQT
jgi:hypothetical protein